MTTQLQPTHRARSTNEGSESFMRMPKLTVRSFAGVMLCLAACGGGNDVGPNAPVSEESPAAVEQEPSADFAPAALQAFAATPAAPGAPRIAACEESAKCVREAAGKEGSAATACREAVGRCLSAISERTAPSLGHLGECRATARKCLANDGDRESCSAEFRDCVKGTMQRGGERNSDERSTDAP